MTLPCIICGKALKSAFPEGTEGIQNQPHNGTTFSTHGHYGSTVFDPMDNTYLEINLCDECLREHKGAVLEGYTKTRYEHTYKPWDPDAE